MQGAIESLISCLGIILFGLIAWQSVVYGMQCQASGEVSLTLQLPFYPVIYGVAFGAACVCLVLLVDFVDALANVSHP
jgi:TRAP-type C4-dicarboxylate transport system permease small subunit